MALMTVKTAIMPSKSAAAHDSKKYYLKFLSTENGENQLNFYSHFMLHWKRRQNISWLFQPKIQKSIDFLSQLLPYGLIFSTVTIHTHASFYHVISYWGVNYNRFCTQNAKRQAFWRMIPTTLARVWKVTFNLNFSYYYKPVIDLLGKYRYNKP